MSKGLELIGLERQRQVVVEGYGTDHDDRHDGQELYIAAQCYLMAADGYTMVPLIWPWSRDSWKPKDRLSNLIRAGALFQAELERLERHPGGSNGLLISLVQRRIQYVVTAIDNTLDPPAPRSHLKERTNE